MKPRLTNRVLRGILLIEDVCGGRRERFEMNPVMGDPSKKEWDDAMHALAWATRMTTYRREKKENNDWFAKRRIEEDEKTARLKRDCPVIVEDPNG
jgi:hypothetical protein